MSGPPFVRKGKEPPHMEVGERATATIQSIQKVDGQYGEQYEYVLVLDCGYRTKDWTKYYELPSTSSNLGKLCTTIWNTLGEVYTVPDAMKVLKEHGKIYLECTGHRTHEGKTYPKLKIVTTVLPKVQGTLPQ